MLNNSEPYESLFSIFILHRLLSSFCLVLELYSLIGWYAADMLPIAIWCLCYHQQAEEYLHDKMEEWKTEQKEAVRRIEDEHDKHVSEMETEHQQKVLKLREGSEDEIGKCTMLSRSSCVDLIGTLIAYL